jgi:hypothetical protein
MKAQTMHDETKSNGSAKANSKELKTEGPLSEKDEVKKAETRTNKLRRKTLL